MEKLKAGVDKLLEYTVITLMAISVVNVLWQVFTRYVMRDPSSYTEELARYLLIWVGLLGASYAAGKNLHLAIDFFTTRLQGRARHLSGLFINLVILLFAVLVMVIGGLRLVNITLLLNQISAALQIKLGYVYLAIPLSGALIAFYALYSLFDNLRGLAASSSR